MNHPDGVRIDLTLPGAELVVEHGAGHRPAPEGMEARVDRSREPRGEQALRVAVREAFETARRRLQDHVRQRQPGTRRSRTPPAGREG